MLGTTLQSSLISGHITEGVLVLIGYGPLLVLVID